MSSSENTPLAPHLRPWQDINRMILDEEVDKPKKNRDGEETNGDGLKKRKLDESVVKKHHLEEIFAKMRDKDFDPSLNTLEELKNKNYQENGTESSTMLHYKEIKDLIMKTIENAFLDKTTKELSPNKVSQGSNDEPCDRKFITVNNGGYKRKISIDGSTEAIKELIKSMFKLRTKRPFWLQDEEQVGCPIDRSMQPGNYTLCVDTGISIKVRYFDEEDLVPVYTETAFFNTEEDYKMFLNKGNWRFLEECDGTQKIAYNMDELQDGVVYRGMK